MRCNAAGEMVYEAVYQIPEKYEGIEIESVMIMPNHIHFMLYNGGGYHIPDIVRWFKNITTNRYIHGVKEKGWTPFNNTFWQRNYFDREVRDHQEFDNVERYIEENPQRWEVEEEDAHVEKRGRIRGYAHTLLLLLVLAFPCCAQNTAGWEDGDPGYTPISPDSAFATGAENLWNHEVFPTMFLFRGGEYKGRTAVVANQTSVVGTTHLVDTLLRAGVNVTKIFCPEHGFRGTAAAGAHVDNSTDPETGLPIISLYGKNKKPTAKQMADVDVVLFDLQDVGCRFYTYLSTLHYVMEACAENDVPLVVLDRPNPNGHYIDGPVLDTAKFRSFVGMHPVPIVYGMTIGEYAYMINGEHWLAGGRECNLTVVPMQGYRRDSIGYELPVPPSPNLRNAHAIALYPSLCLFEGTTVSVGRGTDWPFEVVGTPHPSSVEWNATYALADGQKVYLFTFTPQGEKKCYGFDLREIQVPSKFDLSYLEMMYNVVSIRGLFFLGNNFFEKLAGTGELRKQIMEGIVEEEIRASWQPGIDHFKTIRSRYLIYPDNQ